MARTHHDSFSARITYVCVCVCVNVRAVAFLPATDIHLCGATLSHMCLVPVTEDHIACACMQRTIRAQFGTKNEIVLNRYDNCPHSTIT